MSDIIPFPRWLRHGPIGVVPSEIYHVFMPFYFDMEVDWAKTNLGFWSLPMLEFMQGHRHREVDGYLDATKAMRDFAITQKLYGEMPPIENAKWPS